MITLIKWHWAFLWVEALQQKHFPTPLSLIFKGCFKRLIGGCSVCFMQTDIVKTTLIQWITNKNIPVVFWMLCNCDLHVPVFQQGTRFLFVVKIVKQVELFCQNANKDLKSQIFHSQLVIDWMNRNRDTIFRRNPVCNQKTKCKKKGRMCSTHIKTQILGANPCIE